MIVVAAAGLVISISLLLVSGLNIFHEIRRKYRHSKKSSAALPKDLKQKFFSTMDEIEQLFKAKEIDEDVAFYEIAQTLRNYASEKTGENVRASTREDLENKEGLGVLWETLSVLYEPEFQDRERDPNPMQVPEAIETARQMARRW